MVASRADPQWRSRWGETLLFEAVQAQTGEVQAGETISLLVARGAAINAQNDEGDTPLHWLMLQPGRSKLLKLMLRLGANPNIANTRGELPLHVALRFQP